MGILVPDLQPDAKQVMDGTRATTSGSKIERRVIEKNRRNHMKILYSKLNSLLPNQHSSKEPLSLPEQIDEAINYIKSLESNMQKSKQKRDNLKFGIGKKRSYELCSSSTATTSAKSPAQIQIHEIGSSTLEIVLSTGLDNQFIFYDIIRILDQEQADVVHASISASGDTILHLVRAEMGNLMLDFGAAKITDKLKRIVYGSASDEEVQYAHDQDYFLWDFQIHPQMWDF